MQLNRSGPVIRTSLTGKTGMLFDLLERLRRWLRPAPEVGNSPPPEDKSSMAELARLLGDLREGPAE